MKEKVIKAVFCIVFLLVIVIGIFEIYYFSNHYTNKVNSYVSGIEIINKKQYDISWDSVKDEYNIVTDTKEFKIMQLTDIHIGGTKKTEEEDLKAFQAMYKLVKYAKPDLIVVTGDLVYSKLEVTHSSDNMNSFVMLCSFFENMGVPWTFTFGNHDTEGLAKSEELINTTQLYEKCLYQYKDSLGGRTNLFINIRDRENRILQSLVLFDSGEYTDGEGYDAISEEQIQWYEKRILELSNEQGEVVPSMLFFHIPIQEWKMIYEKYTENSPDIKYFYGRIGEKICSSAKTNTLLSKIFELNSTKAIFVGHDHLNDLSVEYGGVRFTYGKSIDYLAYDGIEDVEYQRGGTLITINNDKTFTIQPIVLSEIG